MAHISVIILTKNSERYLARCLDALRSFQEVIILDNGSTDSTLAIGTLYPNVTIIEHPFIGFGPLKNMALEHATHDWILNIDSDEIVTPKLIHEINTLNLNPQTVYAIHRYNHYQNKHITSCGWGNDWVLRLFNKKMTRFYPLQVHESIMLNETLNVQRLHYPLHHFPFDNASELIEKMQHYSTLYAQEWLHKKKTTPLQALLRALFGFFKYYLLQKGFKDGYPGLLIAFSNACGIFYKYIKLYEANQRL